MIYKFKVLKEKIRNLIKSKRASDDKNAGSAMNIIFAIVIGGLLLTAIYGFLNTDFLPSVFQKLKDLLNYHP